MPINLFLTQLEEEDRDPKKRASSSFSLGRRSAGILNEQIGTAEGGDPITQSAGVAVCVAPLLKASSWHSVGSKARDGESLAHRVGSVQAGFEPHDAPHP